MRVGQQVKSTIDGTAGTITEVTPGRVKLRINYVGTVDDCSAAEFEDSWELAR